MRLPTPIFRLTSPSTAAGTALALALSTAWLPAQSAPTPAPPPGNAPQRLALQAAAEKDRRRTMELLGIQELRPGASFSGRGPHPANYDEAKAGLVSKLPDVLRLNNGRRVTSARVWWKARRPQIAALFDSEILGRVPAHLPAVTWTVTGAAHEAVGGIPVVTKKLVGHVDNARDPAIAVEIELILTIPAKAPGPVPVVMELAFADEFEPAWKSGGLASASAGDTEPSWQQQVLERGWGYAMLSPTSFQADNGAGLTAGIIGLANKGQPRSPGDWGVLRAWAWGASRALDYFTSDPAVDARQVGIAGHSRMGKTALVAMAYDPRFAVAYISSSGEGGAKLYRHPFGEEIGNLAGAGEYHWMAGNFLKYDGPLTVDDLPVDAHELIALCAPRPVFIGAGNATAGGDGWADAKGMFLAEEAAGPVYRLLGKKDLGASEFPPMGTALVSGDLGFRQHAGGHTPAPNWPAFLDFASRSLHAPQTKAQRAP
jgi:hypothetical protein